MSFIKRGDSQKIISVIDGNDLSEDQKKAVDKTIEQDETLVESLVNKKTAAFKIHPSKN